MTLDFYTLQDKIELKILISDIRLGFLTEKEKIRELTRWEKNQKIFIPEVNNYYRH